MNNAGIRRYTSRTGSEVQSCGDCIIVGRQNLRSTKAGHIVLEVAAPALMIASALARDVLRLLASFWSKIVSAIARKIAPLIVGQKGWLRCRSRCLDHGEQPVQLESLVAGPDPHPNQRELGTQSTSSGQYRPLRSSKQTSADRMPESGTHSSVASRTRPFVLKTPDRWGLQQPETKSMGAPTRLMWKEFFLFTAGTKEVKVIDDNHQRATNCMWLVLQAGHNTALEKDPGGT